VKGPLTIQSEQLQCKYRWKAEFIVRLIERPDMTTEEKVRYLQQTFAGLEMYFAAMGFGPTADLGPQSEHTERLT
jgi:hypothetical protein